MGVLSENKATLASQQGFRWGLAELGSYTEQNSVLQTLAGVKRISQINITPGVVYSILLPRHSQYYNIGSIPHLKLFHPGQLPPQTTPPNRSISYLHAINHLYVAPFKLYSHYLGGGGWLCRKNQYLGQSQFG